MKILKSAALALAAALAIGGGFAPNSRAAESTADGPFSGQLGERIKEKLDLSDDQLAQIKNQFKSEKDNLTTLLTRLHAAHTQLRAAIHKADATETSVRAAAAQLSAVEADLAVERLKLYGKISPVLTADQREKLAGVEAGIDQFIERVINRIDTALSE
jgi:Spy/CpxP family protein refolding chaperone